MGMRNPKPILRKVERRKHKIPRIVKEKHALMRTKHLQLGKLKPGDLILVNTHGSVISKGVRKTLNSPFSHVAVYMGEKNGQHMIKDFRKGHGSKIRPLKQIRGRGNNIQVMRWNATPKQMNSYLENINRIKGKYDLKQALGYGIKYRWKKMRGKKIGPDDMSYDDAKRFTCSEFVAEAANPPKEKIESGELVPVDPPLVFDGTHREMVTPKTIYEEGTKRKKGNISFVTGEYYQEYSSFETADLKRSFKKMQ